MGLFINDYISDIVKENPLKYFGLGTLSMQDTDKSIKEMDRCINTLQLNGIEIGTNINGKNLSSKDFNPIFKYAEELDCPIFIHPWDMLGQTDISKYWLPWLVGMPAEITIIDDSSTWEMSVNHIYSKSKNSPMVGMEFKGEIVMTVCGDYAFGKVD